MSPVDSSLQTLPPPPRAGAGSTWRGLHPVLWAVLSAVVVGAAWGWVGWHSGGVGGAFREGFVCAGVWGAMAYFEQRPQPLRRRLLIAVGVTAVSVVPFIVSFGLEVDEVIAFPFFVVMVAALGHLRNRRWERRHGQVLPWHQTIA